MQYRPFGSSGRMVSALGFGAMRLPVLGGDVSRIDEPRAASMIRFAIDGGVNYIDTAYPYHGGTSEPFLARALTGGYRERVMLATKMPTWLVESSADFDRFLAEQMERLHVDYLDFYLLHALNAATWERVEALGVLRWATRAIESGRIGGLGFSFHDTLEVFSRILDAYDGWALAQVQYNYVDASSHPGTAGVCLAAARGIPVVVMEPLRGGQLAQPPPEEVARAWASAPRQRTLVDWALQWLWDQREVTLVLSGMSTMEQVEENVASAARSGVGSLTAEEHALVARVREAFLQRRGVPCTGCGYCVPCPQGVRIPEVFSCYNEALMYDDLPRARMAYRWVPKEHQAVRCTRCGRCAPRCPRRIPIPDRLEEAQALLAPEDAPRGVSR